MSIKTKLSITISLMILLAVLIFHFLWNYQLQKTKEDYLYDVLSTISQNIEKFAYSNKDANISLQYYIETLMNWQPLLLEITIKDHRGNILLGSSTYNDANSESFWMQVKKVKGKLAIQKNAKYYHSYYETSLEEYPFISFIVDRDKYENTFSIENSVLIISLIYLLIIAMIISYSLVSTMIRPLKDVLWKVNEVSSVRFQRPIHIKSRDEFGLLAFRINAMSQNLGIYTNKLRAAFEENRRMRQYLESFINQSNDAIYLIDLDRCVIQSNPAFYQLFGYEDAEIVGQTDPTLPENLHHEYLTILNKLISGKQMAPLETTRLTKNGELIPVSITISPIRDKNGLITAFAHICRDMRHRNKMEELLRQSEKLTTVGQLAAGVAHEIRNPLTTLRGFLQLQEQTNTLNLSHVKVMLSELERINYIVGEFLILAKPQAVKFKVCDVRKILEEVTSFMSSEAILHNIVFKSNYTKDSCFIVCEENQMKQVFINVLKNAIEAMPNGGHVHLAVHRKDIYITILITDEGVGIPEELIQKIGNPFFTAKENGTGLGIMVSQRIINTHQGMFEIQSKENVGTTIKIQLPLWEEKQLVDAINI